MSSKRIYGAVLVGVFLGSLHTLSAGPRSDCYAKLNNQYRTIRVQCYRKKSRKKRNKCLRKALTWRSAQSRNCARLPRRSASKPTSASTRKPAARPAASASGSKGKCDFTFRNLGANRCVKFIKRKMTGRSAKRYCRSIGMDLPWSGRNYVANAVAYLNRSGKSAAARRAIAGSAPYQDYYVYQGYFSSRVQCKAWNPCFSVIRVWSRKDGTHTAQQDYSPFRRTWSKSKHADLRGRTPRYFVCMKKM